MCIPPRRKRGKRIAIIIVSIVAALLVGAGIAVAAYMHAMDSTLSASQSDMGDSLTKATSGQPYYVLLLGSDSREGSGTGNNASEEGDQQRSDVMILARVDEANKQVTLVSIPRDTYWAHDGTVNKINEAYNLGGAARSVQAVEDLTGVKISHCVEISFSGLEDVVDYLGGVEVDVPQDISYEDALTGTTVSISAGKQVLNGQQAQIFARVRKAYTNQDATRQSNVRQIVEAIVKKVKTYPVSDLPQVALKVASCMGTDYRSSDILGLASVFGSGNMTFYSTTGPDVGYNDANVGNAYLVFRNEAGWKRLMAAVNAGSDPSSVDPNVETNAAMAAEGVTNASQLSAETIAALNADTPTG